MRNLNRGSTWIGSLAIAATAAVLCSGFGSCGGDGGSDGGTGKLQYYTTCGDVVCRVNDMGSGTPGVAACTTEKVGDACTTAGKQCDPGTGCGVTLICATSDPKLATGGCPISRRAYKTDIQYLDDAAMSHYADELGKLKLATYKYKSGGPTHLGFIIEDVEPSVSVDSPRDMVDLYGYTSLAVAAVKQQDKKLAALEQKLAELEQKLAAAKSCGRR